MTYAIVKTLADVQAESISDTAMVIGAEYALEPTLTTTKITKDILMSIPDVAAVYALYSNTTAPVSKRTNSILKSMAYKGSEFYKSVILRVKGCNRYASDTASVCIQAFRDHLLANPNKFPDIVDFRTFTVMIENRPDQKLADQMLAIFEDMCTVNGREIPDEIKGDFSPTLQVVLDASGVLCYLSIVARKEIKG